VSLSLVLLGRAFDVLHYGNGLAAALKSALEALAGDMARGVPTGLPARRAAREAVLRRVIGEWDGQSADTFAAIQARLERELPEVARLFRARAARDVGEAPVAKDVALPTAVEGLPVDTWLEAQRADLLLKVEARLRAGVGRGDDAGTIAQEVTAAVNAKGRQTATVARTAATQAANEGYARGMKDAGVEHYVWVAVLDDRTTDICRGLNGQVFRVDDPQAPRPPAHWNCRSHIEPVVPAGEGPVAVLGLTIAGRAGDITSAGMGRAEGILAEFRQRRVRAANVPADLAAALRAEAATVRQQVLGRRGARQFGLGLTLAQGARRDTGTLTLDGLSLRVQR
jgi:SPP1 gp7 family putative phage head morphogenesis protein